jgi:serine/threonine protein kinase
VTKTKNDRTTNNNDFFSLSFSLSSSFRKPVPSMSMTQSTTTSQAAAAASAGTNSVPQPAVDFNVVIAASAPVDNSGSGLVHAVTVIQPVQTWTVIRGQDDFRAVADNLSSTLCGLPTCPLSDPATSANHIANSNTSAGDVNTIVAARNELQQWLTAVLMHPGARESPAIRNFLTYAANMIPPQYENVPWTIFTANGQVATPAPAAPASQQAAATAAAAPPPAPPSDYSASARQSDYSTASAGGGSHLSHSASNLDDMMMDDMFDGADDGDDDAAVGHTDDDDSDGEEEYRASVRYQPTDETITEEDEMDIANAIAGEVEMVEDVGYLAQSMGASHLGRSLMLQEELTGAHKNQHHAPPTQPGLRLGTAVSGEGNNGGGIGSAMEQAPQGLGGSFNQTKPDSPPRLDAFKMVKVIGKGSFGKVFLVRENKTSQMFALKVLKKDNIIRRNQVEHTKTERSVLGYVSHPFIVGMHMAFQSRDKLYFLLDYCAGGELFFHLGKVGKFPEPRARFYAAEIILAISYVHSLDIIYRDLKPENVLLDALGHIRLTDFGLSKEGISSSSSGANSFCGTPEYLAPEILNRQGHGRAVDWWSLGALLYEMLTGLPPFYCQDRERLFEKIRRSELHYPASLSSESKSLLRGLLTKDPTKRLGSGPNDASDIKPHRFFKPIEWDRLQRGEISPPWAPQINGTQDTSQFDREFTSMPIFSPQSMQRAPGFGTTPMGDNPFEGFTFQDRILQP